MKMKASVCFLNKSVAQHIRSFVLYRRIGFHNCFLILPAGHIKRLQTSGHFVQEIKYYSQSEHMATATV